MKKLIIFSTLILLFLCNILIAQKTEISYNAADIPEALKKDAHTVIRYEKTSFEVSNVNKAVTRYKAVITLLNKKSPYAEIGVGYNKMFNNLNLYNIRIYDANGKSVKKLKKSDISDHSAYSNSMFDNSRYKYARVAHDEYPYTIEYEYTETTSMTMFYPDWNIVKDFEISTEKSEFEIITPTSIKVRYKSKNIDLIPNETVESNKNHYHISTENIAAFVDEPIGPIDEKIFPHISFAPDKFGLGDYKGDMSSWKGLGKFSYELNKGRDELSDEMKTKVKELVKNAPSQEEKIKVLYHYLQENMRYVSIQLGIGGWQTFDAKYVERNKYGDCKALTNFMKSMLSEAEVEAYAALIYTGDKVGDLSSDFSSPDFNHVILYVPNGEKDGTWLECTSSDLPPGVVGSSSENRYALLIRPEGGELVRTPKSTKDDNLLISNISIKLTQDGTANIKVDQKATGHQDMRYRYFAFNESEDEIKKALRHSFSLPSFKIKDYTLTPSKETAETQIMLNLEVPKYAARGGKRMFISPNPINQLTYVPREMTDRKLPIETRYAFSDIDIVTIDIPEGYEVESVPQEALTVENDFGKYEIKFEQKGNQLIYTRKMERKLFTLPKERYEEYRKFLKTVTKTDKMKVVLVRNQP